MDVARLDASVGAEVRGVDLGSLSDEEFGAIEGALRTHLLLVFRGQELVEPAALAAFVRRFDPASTTVWRDQATNPWERYKAENMGPAGTHMLPPPAHETLVLGKGELRDHYGLTAVLGGTRAAYGRTSGSQVIGGGKLQWHIDGAFWASGAASGLPCTVTCMRCIEPPVAGEPLEVDYGDGARLRCARGATVFCSGATAFDLLSVPERECASRATVRYAAHPFKRFAWLGMSADGLRCIAGEEVPIEEDERHGALRLPLVWTHPVTGRHALMPHTRCLEAIELLADDGETKELELDAARSWLHTLMRRAVEPELVYAHQWRAGDVAVWDNRAVWHSATGGLAADDRRVMHLVAFDGSVAPICSV